jgi:hypothetical protein
LFFLVAFHEKLKFIADAARNILGLLHEHVFDDRVKVFDRLIRGVLRAGFIAIDAVSLLVDASLGSAEETGESLSLGAHLLLAAKDLL